MRTVLIGSPVYQRAWILRDWFRAIEEQSHPLEKIGFVFEGAPDDEETLDVLFSWHAQHPEVVCFNVNINTDIVHQSHPEGVRRWNQERYHQMVHLRNCLLDQVNSYGFDRYFSLDTDIILENRDTIKELVELTEELDAVAPLMFMTPGDMRAPSVMSWVNEPGGIAVRRTYPLGQLFESDVIMAAKMMSKPVYQNVRYVWHRQGEDLGWSGECARQGFKLYSASHIYAPHIMSQRMLEEYRKSGDKRMSIKD